ncbi:DNA phosphorothioation-dependent restriction protein DptF [Maledivibacter halophilus]|uniref:DNA phosphorothioation-dependent restriction protein DptF n=1 Tax=Maledivibacter halophilus TaxID=36842 RepID=A0A1T5LNR3_9FIRM|nr:DNA phosphorothioation-dependent restriction protein DptF [Maledivibacter halophilus]SKC77564.1 DNA phosphorothioation-dependent restriction protein DptF [Maledivibacter halophilus]
MTDKVERYCLIEELSKLKESSKEAVENLTEFSEFKMYMHVPRKSQEELEKIIFRESKKDGASLILVCGSVGDGKSHIISYLNNKYPSDMAKFKLHNDATESYDPTKTSIDTLNEELDEFSDDKLETSKRKLILAINLGTLSNFIDSQYGYRYSKLKKFVVDKKILETKICCNKYDDENPFQFVNFGDYHLFTLKNGRVYSDYIKSLINKITDPSELNNFFLSYETNCKPCKNRGCCPIKSNYELLSVEKVKEGIVDLLIQCVIKNKIIISTRALLNFLYEIIVSRSFIDASSPNVKNKIANINAKNYIKSLTFNILFNHKELSFIFKSLNSLDPLNIRNSEVDEFIIEFINADDVMEYFDKYLAYPQGYIDKIRNQELSKKEDEELRHELLKLFIRSYNFCGVGNLFSLKDQLYEEYIKRLYDWNRGNKAELKILYDSIKEAILKWNGESEKDSINIFLGKHQMKYKVSERIELIADTKNLPEDDKVELDKFLITMNIRYRGDKLSEGKEIQLDYSLYELLIKVKNGYRPNKKDKNQAIRFVEFINDIEQSGSQYKELLFMEKNREKNRKYRLEYSEEFEQYRFMEM